MFSPLAIHETEVMLAAFATGKIWRWRENRALSEIMSHLHITLSLPPEKNDPMESGRPVFEQVARQVSLPLWAFSSMKFIRGLRPYVDQITRNTWELP